MAGLRARRLARIAIVPLTVLAIGLGANPITASAEDETSGSGCQLNSPGGKIKHVINIVFDNTHFTRDNPNVPSDLEQMPNLLNFIRSNGTLLTNHHTPLISHTATDILTGLTGVYGDRHGVPVSNSYRYFNPDGTTGLGVSFAYWTAPIFDPTTSTPTNTTFNMLTAEGKNAPAPWVPYTRAGCNYGAVSTANVVLENTAIDIPTVFGPNSPESRDPNAFTNYVGIAVHCAKGSAMCSDANNGRPDMLPDEPGGYAGYNGLFGHKYVAPQISPSGPLTDLNGTTIPGFPGFDDMPAKVTLGYVAAMQEHGVPVTYAYISDAHDKHSAPQRAYGPGEAGYVQTLHEYDDAFGKFFTRLAGDGINASNTLFVVTSDEGDHFVGSQPSPTGCNGVVVPCTYSKIGEVNVNIAGLLATQKGVTTPFKVHSDVAPNFYVTGNPDRTDPTTRALEQAVGSLDATNLYTGATQKLTVAMADPVGEKLLHLTTADPTRTPTFTMFALPDYWVYAGAPNCSSPCFTTPPRFAWNHGSTSPDITKTWAGLVGPGVKHQGDKGTYWSDHADLRPTMLALLGLRDDYATQGRVLIENLTRNAIPQSLRGSSALAIQLGQVYKQINAPMGELSMDSLVISTRALNGDSETYDELEAALSDITDSRDALAADIAAALNESGSQEEESSFDNERARELISRARELLSEVRSLAAGSSD